MRHQRILQLDRRNPFAARFDHVFGAVGDLNEAPGVERADIAGSQPAVVKLFRRVVAVITRGDPRAANLYLADRLAVPVANSVAFCNANLNARIDAPGSRAPVQFFFGPAVFGRIRDGGKRAGFGHAPRLNDAHAELFLKALHQAARHRRAAADHHAQRRKIQVVRFAVAQHFVPDRRHCAAEGRSLAGNQLAQRFRLQEA